MRIDRMLAITVILLNRNRISAKELADRFEVSIRTVYRDIDAIGMAGIPIISYAGKQGGFGIIDNFKLDKQLLTMKDMLSMLSALKGINETLEDQELDNAINKIECLIPDDKTNLLEEHLQNISIDILPWGYKSKPQENLKLLHESITSLKIIKFGYENSKGEITERKIEPMTLLFKGYTWYLFSYCLYRNDYRMFRLSRMKNVEVLNEKFIRKVKTHKEYFNESFNDANHVDLVLKFPPKMKQKIIEYIGEENINTNNDGNLIAKISMPEEEWMYTTILGFGEFVEVLEPQKVKEKLKEKLKKICKIYNMT